MNITNKNNPIELSNYDAQDSIWGLNISSDNTKLYLAKGSAGLEIVDISTLNNYTSLGDYNSSFAMSVELNKNETKAFISNEGKGVEILDVSDSSNLMLLGKYISRGNTYFTTLSNDENKMYLTSSSGMTIVDISSPEEPTFLGEYFTNGTKDIAISNDETKAYVATYDGLSIIDLTVDTLHKAQNFGTDNIELKIFTDQAVPLSMSVESNRDDIVIIDSYSSKLSYDEYNSTIVEIPISSITDTIGQTIITVTLSYAKETVIRTIYLNVYSNN